MPIERPEPKAAPVDPHQSWREDLADVLDASKESLLGVVQQKLADEGKVRVSRGVRSPRYRSPARLVRRRRPVNYSFARSVLVPSRPQAPHGPGSISARVVLLCENATRMTSKDDVHAHWTSLISSTASEDDETPETTGIAIVYPDCSIVSLESTTRRVMELTRAIETRGAGECHKGPIRVCASMEDSPFTAYPTGFVSAFVEATTADAYEPEESENLVKITGGVNLAVVKLGSVLQEMNAKNAAVALTDLERAFPEVPKLVKLMGLLKNEDGAPTVTEYLDAYDASLNVDLDAENVWPMPEAISAP